MSLVKLQANKFQKAPVTPYPKKKKKNNRNNNSVEHHIEHVPRVNHHLH